MIDLIKAAAPVANALKGAGKFAAENTESEQERQQTLTERLKIDNQSDSWLSKSVRPITLLTLLALQILIVLLSAFGFTPSETIVIQHGVLMTGALSFYFHSRKQEKIAQKNVEGNIKIQEMQEKSEIRSERKEERHERKMERKEARNQKS